MEALIKAVLDDPVLRVVLIAAIVVAVPVCLTIMVVALLQGRSFTILPPKVGPKPTGARWLIQAGEENIPDGHPKRAEFREGAYKGIKTIVVPVAFDTPFKRAPKVVVSLRKIDLGDPFGSRINRLEVFAEKVGLKGFDLTFKTWEDSMVFDASASWIAFGE